MLPIPSREALLALWGALGMLAIGWASGLSPLVTLLSVQVVLKRNHFVLGDTADFNDFFHTQLQ